MDSRYLIYRKLVAVNTSIAAGKEAVIDPTLTSTNIDKIVDVYGCCVISTNALQPLPTANKNVVLDSNGLKLSNLGSVEVTQVRLIIEYIKR